MTNKMKLSKTTETRGPRHPPHFGGCCPPKTSHGAGGGQPGRFGGGGRAPTRMRRRVWGGGSPPQGHSNEPRSALFKRPLSACQRDPEMLFLPTVFGEAWGTKALLPKAAKPKNKCFWKVCGCSSLAPQASRKSFGTQKQFAWYGTVFRQCSL